MWTRSELKEKAKVAFKANYWVSVLAALVASIFTAAGGDRARDSVKEEVTNLASINLRVLFAILGIAVSVALIICVIKAIIGYALTVGSRRVFIMNETSYEKPSAREIISVFKSGQLANVVLTLLFKDIFIVLWTLVLIIPGIIKGYEYRMIPYILAENPGIDRNTAFDMSKDMMRGNKMNAFILDLSFIGWYIVTALTAGIAGVLYVFPYVEQTNAELYLTLKNTIDNGYYAG